MRLRSCLHAKYEVKRVYDKWPIKYIKVISHSFHINSVGRTLFSACSAAAVVVVVSLHHVWISRKTNDEHKKEPRTKWKSSFFNDKWKKSASVKNKHWISVQKKTANRAEMSRLFQLVMHCLTNIIVIIDKRYASSVCIVHTICAVSLFREMHAICVCFFPRCCCCCWWCVLMWLFGRKHEFRFVCRQAWSF